MFTMFHCLNELCNRFYFTTNYIDKHPTYMTKYGHTQNHNHITYLDRRHCDNTLQ